jgi:hypothetical protein
MDRLLGAFAEIFKRHGHGKEIIMRSMILSLVACAVVSSPGQVSQPSADRVQKPAGTQHIGSDSAAAARKTDTNSAAYGRLPGPDSLKRALGLRDTAQKTGYPVGTGALSKRSADSSADTSYRFWHHPYWGIGAGWGLGSFPLFSEWEIGLPDSSARLTGPGSAVPNFKVREPVNSYNIFWPLMASITPFMNQRHALSIEGAAYFLFSGKSFKASLTGNDSAHSSLEWSQSCAATFFSVGLVYRRTIPEEYFKVENVQRTTANIGLSVVPLMHFSKRSSFTAGNIADSTLAAVEGKKDNRAFNGVGGAWNIGISALRRLSAKSGVEIGITYIGRYYGYFKNGSNRMLWKDLNPGYGRPGEKISFLSHTFEISLVLQTGKAGKTKTE